MDKIKIQLLNEMCAPVVGSEHAAGLDLKMNIKTQAGFTPLAPNEVIECGTGIKVDIPRGWVGIVTPRSGLGFKYEIFLANTVGVIDSDYTGEIKIKIRNRGDETAFLDDYIRICQMVIVPHYLLWDNLEFVDKIEKKTARGEKGFGSSGRT